MTGGSAGIGFGIVAHLLHSNAEKIYLLSNKEQHAEEAQEGLKKYGDVNRVEWKKCDLEDLKFTDKVARELSELQHLDGVSCCGSLALTHPMLILWAAGLQCRTGCRSVQRDERRPW